MLKIYAFILIILPISAFAQENDNYENRLTATNKLAITYFNIDGINFSSETLKNSFTEKELKSVYRKYSIKNENVKTDQGLLYRNFKSTRTEKITDSLNQITSYYFVEDKQKKITTFSFNYFSTTNSIFERKFIKLILENQIPANVFQYDRVDTINFAGRKIKTESKCYWTFINTIQCPYNGEMNWSVHKTLKSAENAISNQRQITMSKRSIKIVSEQYADVIFEGKPTRAKKVIYDFSGLTGFLTKSAGARTLTAYYVATPVRSNYVSCVMSFWNSDKINESGLPTLLENVMQLNR